MRKLKFQNDYYYHIYNRGVDKRNIFLDEKDYIRFLVSMKEFNTPVQLDSLYRIKQIRRRVASKSLQVSKAHCSDLEATEPLVKIVTYALLPNHFHFLLKQLGDNGISRFMHKLSMGYTFYFNHKHNRSGSLFQGTYKAKEVKDEGYLLKLSCYINGNPEIHGITEAKNYKWSSYMNYLGIRNGTLCNKNIILKEFQSTKEYEDLVNIVIKESKEFKDEFKKYLLE